MDLTYVVYGSGRISTTSLSALDISKYLAYDCRAYLDHCKHTLFGRRSNVFERYGRQIDV